MHIHVANYYLAGEEVSFRLINDIPEVKGFGKFVYVPKTPKDNSKTNPATSDYAVLKTITSRGTLLDVFKNWELHEFKLFFLFIAHDRHALDLWHLIRTTALKARKFGEKIAFVIIGSFTWPDTWALEKMAGVPCIRVHFQLGIFRMLTDAVDISEEECENERDGNFLYHFEGMKPVMSHYLFLDNDVESFISLAKTELACYELAIVYGDVNYFWSDHKSYVLRMPSNHHFKETLFLSSLEDNTR